MPFTMVTARCARGFHRGGGIEPRAFDVDLAIQPARDGAGASCKRRHRIHVDVLERRRHVKVGTAPSTAPMVPV